MINGVPGDSVQCESNSIFEVVMQPGNKAQLQSILKYHVLAGKVGAVDLIALAQSKIAHGGELKIDIDSSA